MRLIFRRPEKSYFSDFGKKSFATMGDNHLRRPFLVENEWFRSKNNTYFIDFVPYLGQFMSNHRLKCLAEGLIVTKTSLHAGFWCLSLIKRSTRLPNWKTFCDVRHLWLPFFYLLGTCGLLFGVAHFWSETNFFRDSNPCGLHSQASNNPTNTVFKFARVQEEIHCYLTALTK